MKRDEKRWEDMDEKRWEEERRDKKRLKEMRRDEKRWEVMRKDEKRRDEKRWMLAYWRFQYFSEPLTSSAEPGDGT